MPLLFNLTRGEGIYLSIDVSVNPPSTDKVAVYYIDNKLAMIGHFYINL